MNTAGARLLTRSVSSPLGRSSQGRALIDARFGRVQSAAAILLLAAGSWSSIGCKSTLDNVSINDTFGRTGRHVKNLDEQAKREAKGEPPAGAEELSAAQKLYEEQKYAEARTAFHKIVKKYKKKNEPVEEDAMFYRAECDFQLNRLPEAEEGYTELMKKYQTTKYLDKAINRLYRIARYWLNSPKPVSEIELASFTEEASEERLKEIPEASIPWNFPLKPNLFDKTRPIFDTDGRAVQALRNISIQELNGPLADDALMTLATYHLRRKDYREADRYFSMIREQCTNSEFAPDAYALGAYASLKSYQGAQYDGKQLDEAKKNTQAAIRMFPDKPWRAKLEQDLKKIEAEAAERDWARVQFHMRRREKDSAAFYCETIIEKFPESPRVQDARDLLTTLGPKHAAGILTTPLFPKKTDKAKEAPPYDEPEEPGRLRLSDRDDAKPIS
ncbi:MAG TPA: tetratricopeptide repeat protein [Planctomycetaceae bacterium]|nr:tetratricopeptide repeat protein [Planctomycetaceae bacterium]